MDEQMNDENVAQDAQMSNSQAPEQAANEVQPAEQPINKDQTTSDAVQEPQATEQQAVQQSDNQQQDVQMQEENVEQSNTNQQDTTNTKVDEVSQVDRQVPQEQLPSSSHTHNQQLQPNQEQSDVEQVEQAQNESETQQQTNNQNDQAPNAVDGSNKTEQEPAINQNESNRGQNQQQSQSAVEQQQEDPATQENHPQEQKQNQDVDMADDQQQDKQQPTESLQLNQQQSITRNESQQQESAAPANAAVAASCLSGSRPVVAHSTFARDLFNAVKKGDLDKVVNTINQYNIDTISLRDELNFQQTLAFNACVIKDEQLSLSMLNLLVDMNVDPCLPDTLKQTCVYYAVREGFEKVINRLLELGCNINHVDMYGQTPIFYSVREGNVETTKLLVNKGAQHDIVDNNGQTPMFYAIKFGKIEMCEYLIRLGVNLKIDDKRGQTPSHWARKHQKQNILELLLQNGAVPLGDSKSKTKFNKKPAPPKAVPEVKQKVNERKISRRYLLTVLREGGFYEPLTDEEFDQFKADNPELARYFEEDDIVESIEIPEIPEAAPIYDQWERAAQRLMNTLGRHSQAWLFAEPVDPEKFGIKDYFKVINHPMDFGTVKTKLKEHQYENIQQFLDDITLTFNNCLKYNGEQSNVGGICKTVMEEYHKLYDQLYIKFYL